MTKKWTPATPPTAEEMREGSRGRVKNLEWRLARGQKLDLEGNGGDLVLQVRSRGGEWAKVGFDFYGVALMAHYRIEEHLYKAKGGGEYFLTHLAALVFWAREQYRPGEFSGAASWRRILGGADNASEKGARGATRELEYGSRGVLSDELPEET